MRDYLSASQIITYLSCSLKYRFRYIEERPAERLSAALAFGKAIHSALASYHESILEDARLSLADVQALWRAYFLAETTEPLAYSTGESAETLLELGTALIARYVETCQFDIVGVEHPFRVPLCDPDTGDTLVWKPLHGFFDALVPGGIVEMKTAKSAMNPDVLARHLQLTAYAYAYEWEHGTSPEVTVVQLLKLKKPRVEQTTVRRERQDLRFFLRCAQAVERGIEAAVFAPNPSWQCATCEYSTACRDWPASSNTVCTPLAPYPLDSVHLA